MQSRKPREARMIRVTKSEEGERILITPRDSGVFETLTKGLSPVNNG